MSIKKQIGTINWDKHFERKYGKMQVQKYAEEFETFNIGVLIKQERKKQNMTQEELALRIGTTKNYISRIENNTIDIRLSTLVRIIRDGLGGELKLKFLV